MSRKVIDYVSLISMLIFIIIQSNSVSGQIFSENDMSQNQIRFSELISKNKIEINGEQDFINQANSNNWVGNGSEPSPYIIDGYLTNYIEISNTNNLFFILQNNTINGITAEYDALPKIALSGVSGAIVRTNSIISNYFGISLQSTKLSEISDNTIEINLICGSCNSFGIYLDSNDDGSSFGNIVRRNLIDSYGSGIILMGYNNFVDSNFITYSSLDQWGASWGHGIHILSDNNEITRNTISNKYGYGVLVQEGGRNIIDENNFISNSISLSNPTFSYNKQAGDYKSTAGPYDISDYNTFEGNYWSDWILISLDADDDNVLDDPYRIDNNWESVEDVSPATIKHDVLEIIDGGNKIDEETEVDKNEALFIPFQKQIVIGILVSSIIAIFRYNVIYLPRTKDEALTITEKIGEEISSIFQNHTSMFHLILSQKNKKPTPTEDELAKSIPKEIFDHKFLMHPVRLAMAKLLFETIELTSIELKNSLDLSWGDYSSHIKALKKKKFIYIREEFRDVSVKQVITLTDLGYKSYENLKSILCEFLSNSPENYLDYVDKHYSDQFEIQD